jgi:hypothetical protein
MDRVTQQLWRGVEGPRRDLSLPMLLRVFNHRASRRRGPLRLSPVPETKNLLASQQIFLAASVVEKL